MGPVAIRCLLVLCVTQTLNWAFIYYAFALWAPRILKETGWSETLVYGGFSLALLASGLCAPYAGKSVDRLGGRPVLTLGTLIGAGGLVVLAFSHSPESYLLAFVLIGAGMAGALYDPAFATLSQAAGPHTRRAISLLTLAGGFASTLSWPLTLWLLQDFDWRAIALIYAAVLTLVCAPLHAFLLPKASERGTLLQEGPASASNPSVSPASAAPILNSPEWLAMTLFALVIMMHGFVTSAFSVHLVHVLDTLGLGEAAAVMAGSLVGPAQVLARLIEMLYGRRLPALITGVFSVVLLPVAFGVLISLPTGLATAILFGLFYGASNGLVTIVRGIVPLALFGPHGYGRRLGLISAPSLAVKAASPMVVAAVLAGSGGRDVLFMSLASGLIATLAMTTLFIRERHIR